MRTEDLFSKPSSAVLDAPEEIYAPAPAASRRRSRQPEPVSRRDFGDDFADNLPDPRDEAEPESRRKRNYRLRFQGRALQIPKTTWGRVASGVAFAVFLGCLTAVVFAVRSFFLHDPRFVISTSASIQTVGNTHLTRAQLLSVFGEDVERNIFNVPLAERRAELERLPWVEHATVMRLLPNHLRIAIIERTPVAFVRQGTQIGMVDATGVLLDMPTDAPGDPNYSFPVVTGIAASDPLSTRAARMRIYGQFTSDLDSTGNHISGKLSEVDLSNPEDIKALIPEGSSDILVHFGDVDFLARYQKFEQHLAEWRTQYPKLSAVDMRYERQVVLEMQPGASTVPTSQQNAAAAQPASTAPAVKAVPAAKAPAIKTAPAIKPTTVAKTIATKPTVKAPTAKTPPHKPAAAPAKAVGKPKPKPAAAAGDWHMVVVKPHTKAAAALAAKSKLNSPTHPPQAGQQ